MMRRSSTPRRRTCTIRNLANFLVNNRKAFQVFTAQELRLLPSSEGKFPTSFQEFTCQELRLLPSKQGELPTCCEGSFWSQAYLGRGFPSAEQVRMVTLRTPTVAPPVGVTRRILGGTEKMGKVLYGTYFTYPICNYFWCHKAYLFFLQ